MRPRHYTGESDAFAVFGAFIIDRASMRPRHYTGESAHRFNEAGARAPGFNEAPALHRGKSRIHPRRGGAADPASMRPRHYTGESSPEGVNPTPISYSFNEAPALHRGKL